MRLALALLVTAALVACDSDIETGRPAAPPVAGEPPHSVEPPQQSTEAEQSSQADIRGEEITYSVGDTTLKGYLAYDASIEGERPGVLVVHEWWGHNDYVRNRAHMLARMGYTALALDMYGDGKVAEHPDDAQKFMAEAMAQADVSQQRFLAAKQLLEQHPTTDADDTAAIGYCFGGGIVLQMARNGVDLDGVASFHGTLATEKPAQEGEVDAKILVLHGADDPFIPREQVEAFKKEMDKANADYEFIAYPGATHSFTNPNATAMGEKFDMPLAYNEEADAASWQRLEQFLEEIFAE